jgi:hypothetical protein
MRIQSPNGAQTVRARTVKVDRHETDRRWLGAFGFFDGVAALRSAVAGDDAERGPAAVGFDVGLVVLPALFTIF